MRAANKKAAAAATTATEIMKSQTYSTSFSILVKAAKRCPQIPDILDFLALMMLPLTTRLYEDFRRIIQKTVRRYPALETALSALSMLSIVLTAGLAEQQPAWATVAALAGMLAALTLRGADCSTTGVQSRTESNRRHAVNTWATASPARWTARRSSRSTGRISGGEQ